MSNHPYIANVFNSKYKNSNGALLSQALFYETNVREEDKASVLYTMKSDDYLGYPSIKRLYLECDDPTEYTFAIKYFDSWKHWKMVRDATFFKETYEEMREELLLRIKSRAVASLRKAINDPKNVVQVSKYLIDGGYIDKEDTRGRPSKQRIKEEANKIFKDMEDVDNDYNRIVVIQ